jgi:hypothetical protein
MSKWINVKDKLPDKEGRYLVYKQSSYGNFFNIANFSFNLEKVDEYDFYKENRCGWYGYDSEWGHYKHDNITHWMPLPEEPKD